MWLFRAHFSVKLLSHRRHVNFLHGVERKGCKYYPHGSTSGPDRCRSSPAVWRVQGVARRTAGLVCHVCITRHWFFCPGLALQPFILCFAVGPNGFEKFCYSPVTPEANVRIDFTCTGLHHLSRAQAVRAKAKWKAIILNYSDTPALCQAEAAGAGRHSEPSPPGTAHTTLLPRRRGTLQGRLLFNKVSFWVTTQVHKKFPLIRIKIRL